MANGPLGLNTSLLLPSHRSSTQHTRTRRCSTWKCSETKTYAPSLFATLAERAERPAPFCTALRRGFMNDCPLASAEDRRRRRGERTAPNGTLPHTHSRLTQTPLAFKGRRERGGGEGRRCHPNEERDHKN